MNVYLINSAMFTTFKCNLFRKDENIVKRAAFKTASTKNESMNI